MPSVRLLSLWSVIVRGDAIDVDAHAVRVDVVEHAPLVAEPRRSSIRKFASELIVKRLDHPQPMRTGLTDDRTPDRVLLRYVSRKLVERLCGVARFHDRPHAL